MPQLSFCPVTETLFSPQLLFTFLNLCSLENAGENSVLSILRCVRSVLGLLHSNMGNGNFTSIGISYEVAVGSFFSSVFIPQSTAAHSLTLEARLKTLCLVLVFFL